MKSTAVQHNGWHQGLASGAGIRGWHQGLALSEQAGRVTDGRKERKREIARVQPRWIQGDSKVGMESASLEITYLITDREGLENQQRKRG